MSIVRSPEAHEQLEKVVLVHGCRLVSELACDRLIRSELPNDPQHDRLMLCGSPAMLADTRTVLDKFRCSEGNMSRPGEYVIERACRRRVKPFDLA